MTERTPRWNDLVRRDGKHGLGTSRDERDGSGKSQSEGREVLHGDDVGGVRWIGGGDAESDGSSKESKDGRAVGG